MKSTNVLLEVKPMPPKPLYLSTASKPAPAIRTIFKSTSSKQAPSIRAIFKSTASKPAPAIRAILKKKFPLILASYKRVKVLVRCLLAQARMNLQDFHLCCPCELSTPTAPLESTTLPPLDFVRRFSSINITRNQVFVKKRYETWRALGTISRKQPR